MIFKKLKLSRLSLIGLLSMTSIQGCPATQEKNMAHQHTQHSAEQDMRQMNLSDTHRHTDALDMSHLKQAPSAKSTPTTASPEFLINSQSALYRCPMHPQIVQDKTGSCPICGMDLEKVQQTSTHSGTSLQDRAAVQINLTRQQLIGVKTTTIQEKKAQHSIFTVAKIAENEEQRSHIHTKYTGWVEEVYANFKGQYVQKGQALLKIYSPDLVAAQEEYLLALKTVQ